MLPNWGFQLTLITFFGTQLLVQIIAFPVEGDFVRNPTWPIRGENFNNLQKDKNNHLSKRAFRKALPIFGGVVAGGALVAGYNHFTKSSGTTTAPGTSLNSAAGGPLGNPFGSASGSPTGSELDSGDQTLGGDLSSSVVKRNLLGKNTYKSTVTARDLNPLPRADIIEGVESSFKRSVAAFSTIVAGSAVIKLLLP
ncbi:hypothetical protein Golomagni_05465 [Golovinomyces magnicellulatus]|nr:hypothetical protein Golomagni_05465 [Golovinomyces magnicellulatus]